MTANGWAAWTQAVFSIGLPIILLWLQSCREEASENRKAHAWKISLLHEFGELKLIVEQARDAAADYDPSQLVHAGNLALDFGFYPGTINWRRTSAVEDVAQTELEAVLDARDTAYLVISYSRFILDRWVEGKDSNSRVWQHLFDRAEEACEQVQAVYGFCLTARNSSYDRTTDVVLRKLMVLLSWFPTPVGTRK
ncbi:hypothetical protein [Salinisphaera sp. S4-8]|uniref:hypothetical protein n=1 Tax=Salinisphaera sp. S4-8 TaxID=633357 RepID=UPI00333F3E65